MCAPGTTGNSPSTVPSATSTTPAGALGLAKNRLEPHRAQNVRTVPLGAA